MELTQILKTQNNSSTVKLEEVHNVKLADLVSLMQSVVDVWHLVQVSLTNNIFQDVYLTESVLVYITLI